MSNGIDLLGVRGRRAFLRNGTLFLLGSGRLKAAENSTGKRVRFGLVTDMHYADKDAAGSRHYRESIGKLAEAAQQFVKDQPNHIVELGDFIDAADSVTDEKKYLARIQKAFKALPGTKHYVLGNHCVHTLTKEEFLKGVGQKRSFYSFDAGNFHFIVLDACFRSDGEPYGRKNFKWDDANIPESQLRWLLTDLKKSGRPSVVFLHQRLDLEDGNHYSVNNATVVRKIMEKSGQVLAVFQGHSHECSYKRIKNIHYCTLKAMVEGSGAVNNGYSTMDIFEDGTIQIKGFRKQDNYRWE